MTPDPRHDRAEKRRRLEWSLAAVGLGRTPPLRSCLLASVSDLALAIALGWLP